MYADAEDLINLAKREIEKNREMMMSRSMSDNTNNSNNTDVVESEVYVSDDSDSESDNKSTMLISFSTNWFLTNSIVIHLNIS